MTASEARPAARRRSDPRRPQQSFEMPQVAVSAECPETGVVPYPRQSGPVRGRPEDLGKQGHDRPLLCVVVLAELEDIDREYADEITDRQVDLRALVVRLGSSACSVVTERGSIAAGRRRGLSRNWTHGPCERCRSDDLEPSPRDPDHSRRIPLGDDRSTADGPAPAPRKLVLRHGDRRRRRVIRAGGVDDLSEQRGKPGDRCPMRELPRVRQHSPELVEDCRCPGASSAPLRTPGP